MNNSTNAATRLDRSSVSNSINRLTANRLYWMWFIYLYCPECILVPWGVTSCDQHPNTTPVYLWKTVDFVSTIFFILLLFFTVIGMHSIILPVFWTSKGLWLKLSHTCSIVPHHYELLLRRSILSQSPKHFNLINLLAKFNCMQVKLPTHQSSRLTTTPTQNSSRNQPGNKPELREQAFALKLQ